MEPEKSIAITKALADQSRLAMINSLLERSQYVEELAKRHGLAPSTVSFHLRKLEQAGLVTSRKEQYYVVVSANTHLLDTTLREIIAANPAGKELQEVRMDEYRRKVLETFFRDGRLEKLPSQHKKRLIVLEQLLHRFEPKRRYPEAEVTALIVPVFDDYCTVRRLLVDEGLLERDGTHYWSDAQPGCALCELASLSAKPEHPKKMGKEMTNRADLKRMYKETRPDMGIYQIRNTENGKIYVGTSQNLEATRTSRMFQLRMGSAVFSRELQGDLNHFGAASFEFSVLGILDKEEARTSPERSLTKLKLKWLEKLQPFGERGYNSIKAYQREQREAGAGPAEPGQTTES